MPSIPARNETPEELSLASEPEWLNADYDESEDDAPWKLTQADIDTSEILIGRM
jgi:hypothetical protein